MSRCLGRDPPSHSCKTFQEYEVHHPIAQLPLNQKFMSAWGAPQQAQFIDKRFCIIFQCLYPEESHVFKGANCRRLQQGTDCLNTVAHILLCQLNVMCEPPREEGTVQWAAVQVLGLGEIGKLLQPCLKCCLGCLSLWSGRHVQQGKLDDALGDCRKYCPAQCDTIPSSEGQCNPIPRRRLMLSALV